MKKRKFDLAMLNGHAVQIPTTRNVEETIEYLQNRGGGFLHIVAYTDAKALKKARLENMDLVKITDCMCINGLPKREEEVETTDNQAPTRARNYERINYALIRYENGSYAITPHLSNNPKHRVATYYMDRNNGRVYDKQYLIENGYISSYTRPHTDGIKWLQFKVENIIYIK